MSVLNQLNCLSNSGNTGVGECSIDIKNIVSVILVPTNFALSGADLLTPESVSTKLKELTLAGKTSRIYPINNIIGITNNSTEPATATNGYGGITVINDGKTDITFNFDLGGLCLSKELRKFNKSNKSVLLIDSAGVLYGIKVGPDLKGIPLEVFYANPFTINDGSNATVYSFRLVFDPKYLNDEVGFISGTPGTWAELSGLLSVALTSVSSTATTAVVQATTGCDKTNLGLIYGDELSVAGAWIVTNTATGASVTPTSVAVNSTTGLFTLTFATPPASVTISLASPSDLADLDVVGYESNTVTISIP